MMKLPSLLVAGVTLWVCTPLGVLAAPINPASQTCAVDPNDKKTAICPRLELVVSAQSDGCHMKLTANMQEIDSLEIPKGTKDVSLVWGFASGTPVRYVFNLLNHNGIEFDDKDKEFTVTAANAWEIDVTNKNNKKNPHPYVLHVVDSLNFFSACVLDPIIVNQGQ